jgi:hypothetical protein
VEEIVNSNLCSRRGRQLQYKAKDPADDAGQDHWLAIFNSTEHSSTFQRKEKRGAKKKSLCFLLQLASVCASSVEQMNETNKDKSYSTETFDFSRNVDLDRIVPIYLEINFTQLQLGNFLPATIYLKKHLKRNECDL